MIGGWALGVGRLLAERVACGKGAWEAQVPMEVLLCKGERLSSAAIKIGSGGEEDITGSNEEGRMKDEG